MVATLLPAYLVVSAVLTVTDNGLEIVEQEEAEQTEKN